MGRPHGYTPERGAIIIDQIEQGNWFVTACRRAGIQARTVRGWIKTATEHPELHPELVDFVVKLDQTKAEAEGELVQAWRNGAAHDWKAAAELLKKRFPKRWGDAATKLELSGPKGGAIRTASATESATMSLVWGVLSAPAFEAARIAVAAKLAEVAKKPEPEVAEEVDEEESDDESVAP